MTTLSPHHSSARRLLALAHCTLGEPEKAIEIFEQWLEEEPDNPIRGTCSPPVPVATCRSGPRTRTSRTVFDEFAASFEAKLAKLSYRAPAIRRGDAG